MFVCEIRFLNQSLFLALSRNVPLFCTGQNCQMTCGFTHTHTQSKYYQLYTPRQEVEQLRVFSSEIFGPTLRSFIWLLLIISKLLVKEFRVSSDEGSFDSISSVYNRKAFVCLLFPIFRGKNNVTKIRINQFIRYLTTIITLIFTLSVSILATSKVGKFVSWYTQYSLCHDACVWVVTVSEYGATSIPPLLYFKIKKIKFVNESNRINWRWKRSREPSL